MRRTGLTVQLTALGNGEVNTVMASETLLQPDRAYVVAPLSPGSPNCRLLNSVVTPRFGYKTIGPATPATAMITGLFQATFDDNTVENLRSDSSGATATRYLSTTWASIGAAGVGSNWTYAMVRRAGSVSPANQVMLSSDATTDNVWVYTGGGVAATKVGDTLGGGGTGFRGAKAIVGHRGRSLVMNTYDVFLVKRKVKRVNYSILGNPALHNNAFGSGFVDLDDDPYPIANAKIIGGNVCVFNGNNLGGSLVVGTATGVSNAPYRWDTVNTDNVGLLVPRSLVLVTTNLAFFLSHAGFALYDGARNLAPVAEGISRDILSRLNYAKLNTGFAWFKPASGEIHVALAMGSAVTPNETWVFNFTERRVYGPYTYGHSMTAAAPYATTNTLTWQNATGNWNTGTYANWNVTLGRDSSRGIMFGTSVGTTWLDDEATPTDNNAPVDASYYCAPFRASGRTLIMPDGSQRQLAEDDYLTLHDITLTYRNRGVWHPAVAVSTDGGTNWTTATAGVSIGSDTVGLGRSFTAPYSFDGLSGTWFQARIFGSAPMELLGVRMEFGYGGNARND